MKYKIVSDSSCNIFNIEDVNFSSVPLHIIVGDDNFIDDKNVDVKRMQEALDSYNGKTSTSCPSPDDWIKSFEDCDTVFCITITSALSGSFSSANIAKNIYESDNPGKRVYIYDSLSTGPEMALLIEYIKSLILDGLTGEEINKKALEYQKHTHLYFSLASLNNLAKNGRVNSLVAKGIGVLGIRIVGRASSEGTLEPINKVPGERKAIKKLIEHMKKCGYSNGKIKIHHNNNIDGAMHLKASIKETFGEFNGEIGITGALCSYYAEPLSLLIAFEA